MVTLAKLHRCSYNRNDIDPFGQRFPSPFLINTLKL